MIKHFTAALLGASALVLAPRHGRFVELAVLDSRPAPATAPDGQSINELSGLAWDADEKLLYAVSDDGVLHHFRLEIADGRIANLEPVQSVPLRAGMAPQVVNAEGLAVSNGNNGKQGDTQLLVAFEDGPAIHRFKPDGTVLGALQLPEALADAAKYSEANSRSKRWQSRVRLVWSLHRRRRC